MKDENGLAITRWLEARAERAPWIDGIKIYLFARLGDGTSAYVENIMMKGMREGDPIAPEPMIFSIEGAQRLMDELWNCGLRPSEGTGSAGTMRQAEDHLATLKKDNERLYSLIATLIDKEFGE